MVEKPGMGLLRLAADLVQNQIAEAAFGGLAEVVVAGGFFAYHRAPAAIAAIEPLRGRSGYSVRAVESHSRAHLYKRTTLRKLRWILVLHPHQRRPLIVLEYPDRAHRNGVSRFRLSDRLPFSSSPDECHEQDGRERYRENEEEGLFQCKFPSTNLQHHFGALNRFCQSVNADPIPAPRLRGIVYPHPRLRRRI